MNKVTCLELTRENVQLVWEHYVDLQNIVDFIQKSKINLEFLNYYKSNALKASLNYTPYNATKFI